MENIFVTGANGCIGSELVRGLLAEDYRVTALALDEGDTENIKDMENIHIVLGDICDEARMRKIFSRGNFAVVIHLAAVVHRPRAAPGEFIRVNTDATAALFEIAREKGVRQFIFVSTVAVYGDRTDRAFNENDAAAPTTPYGISKLKAEEYIASHADGKIRYTIIRPATVYGRLDRGNIHRLFRVVSKRIVPVIGNGRNRKSLVYVRDLTAGMIKAVKNPRAYDQTVILADRRPYSVNEILREMEKIIGKRILVFHIPAGPALFLLGLLNKIKQILSRQPSPQVPSASKLTTDTIFDISRAKKLLSYDPEYDLAEGLRLTYLPGKK